LDIAPHADRVVARKLGLDVFATGGGLGDRQAVFA